MAFRAILQNKDDAVQARPKTKNTVIKVVSQSMALFYWGRNKRDMMREKKSNKISTDEKKLLGDGTVR